jgi:hypothetical protein
MPLLCCCPHPLALAPALRARGDGPHPLAPAPALRTRGDLVRGIAPAPIIPLFSPRVGAEGFGGKVRGRPACSAAPALNPVPAWFRIVGDEASRHVPI